MTWKEWTKLAGDLFAMTDKRDDGVLAAWSRVFAGQGTTPDEAAEAARWLARHDPPAFRQAVLPALQARLKAMSGEQAARESSDAHEGPRCTLCDGVGMVHAACPDAHAAGRYKEIALYCRCPLGKWKRCGMADHLQEKKGTRPHLCDVDDYDACAEWCDVSTGEVHHGADARRGMLKDMRARLGREMSAEGAARDADAALGAMSAPSAFRAAIAGARKAVRP